MKKTFVMFFVLGALSINVLEAYTLVELENLSEKVALQDVLSYAAAFEAANEEFDNNDSEIKVLVFELFYRLALQGQYLEAIFKIVEHGVVDNDFRVKRGSLSLAEALVEEGVYLEELHRLVIPCIYDDNYKVREAAFQAAAVFVEAGHFFEQIFLASEWVLTNENEHLRVKKAAFKVRDALVRKGQYQKLILENARKELESDNGFWNDAHRIIISSEERGEDTDEDIDFCIDSLGHDHELWGSVLDYLKSKAIDELTLRVSQSQVDSYLRAIKSANEAYYDSDACIRIGSLKLYAALVKKGQAFDDAKKAAVRILENDLINYYGESDDSDCTDFGEDSGVVHAARDLLIALVEQGHAHDEAILIAERCEYSDVLTALIEQGKGHELAIKLLEKEYNDPDYLTEQYIPDLLVALAEKNQAQDLALAWALKVIYNREINDSYNFQECEIPRAIKVLIALVKNGHALNEALAVAQERACLDLFAALIDLQHGLDEALYLVKNYPGIVWASKDAACFLEALFHQGLIDAQEIYLILRDTYYFTFHLERFGSCLAIALKDVQDRASQANNICFSVCEQSEFFGDLFHEEADVCAAAQAFNKGLAIDEAKLSFLCKAASLVKRGKHYEEAFSIAQQALNDENRFIKKAGLKLLALLVKKEKFCQQVQELASSLIKNDNPRSQKFGWKLYRQLVEKGQNWEQIVHDAQQELGKKDGHWNKAYQIISMVGVEKAHDRIVQINELITQLAAGNDEYILQAIEEAKAAYTSSDPSMRKKSLKLYKTLVDKGYAFDDAAQASLRIFENELGFVYTFGEDIRVVNAARNVLVALVKKGFAHEKVIKIVEKVEYGDLAEALVEQGQGYEQAIKIAKKYDLLPLFTKLVERGQGFEQALEASKKVFQKEYLTSEIPLFFQALFRQNLIAVDEIGRLINGIQCPYNKRHFRKILEWWDEELRVALQNIGALASESEELH